MTDKSFEECAKDENGHIYFDQEDSGFRVLVMKGPSSVNAYIGVPLDHFLCGIDYDNVHIDCHGGLTFSMLGDGPIYPLDWYWFGWDYAHHRDACFYDLEFHNSSYLDGFPWTPELVLHEAMEVLEQFKEYNKCQIS